MELYCLCLNPRRLLSPWWVVRVCPDELTLRGLFDELGRVLPSVAVCAVAADAEAGKMREIAHRVLGPVPWCDMDQDSVGHAVSWQIADSRVKVAAGTKSDLDQLVNDVFTGKVK